MNSFSALRHSYTLYLGMMTSPGAASDGGEETAQVVFLVFGSSDIKKHCLK